MKKHISWHGFSLVHSLCTSLSTSADVFISIDCGSSSPFRDENGIAWLGDDKYVQSGESRSVKPLNSRPSVKDTLRVFTTRNKNCYHSDSVKKGRVLVRASFYYGNYDGKSFPPTFDLHFDGNFWTNVQTSITEFYYYEVTYVLKRESISVCLAQTKPGQFPFISALEVRSLESSMYNYVNDSYPLLVWKRVAFGSNKVLRFQEDPYDRLWNVGLYGNGSIPVSGDAIFTQRPNVIDNPPPAVLRNAITAKTPNTSVELLMGFPSYEINVYINWYFSEVTRLGPGQNRSFRIFKDNESYSEPIIPLYGDCVEMILDSANAVSSNTTFSLVPTNVSTLLPLINALEIFQLPDDKLTDGTNKKDVEGLASLQERFKLLQSWTSDPCLPAPYTWDWIKCSLDPIPRVTALLLNGYGLSGSLPDFSSMDALQTKDVQNNRLRGPIPDFLGTLPNLKILNLADNQFNGSVPASLSTKKGLNLTVSGNPGLYRMLSWIECSNDYPVRRVTSLQLQYQRLYGILSDFSEMDALESIELHGNNLMGSIPEFLGYLPSLTYLNLAFNYFSGRVPYSLVNNKRIHLIVTGNSGLCDTSYSCSSPYSPPAVDFDAPDVPRRTTKKLVKILAGVIPASFLITMVGAICACYCRKSNMPPAPAAGAATDQNLTKLHIFLDNLPFLIHYLFCISAV